MTRQNTVSFAREDTPKSKAILLEFDAETDLT
jgi:hypothetical protein